MEGGGGGGDGDGDGDGGDGGGGGGVGGGGVPVVVMVLVLAVMTALRWTAGRMGKKGSVFLEPRLTHACAAALCVVALSSCAHPRCVVCHQNMERRWTKLAW